MVSPQPVAQTAILFRVTGSDGTTDIGNSDGGVLINTGSNSNIIGGDTAGEANLIRFNDDYGVRISGTNNAIIGNSLYSNTSPNIDLGDDGVTANDANDVDSGPNDLLNFPEWSTYTESAGNTSVEYTLDVPAGDYRVETFSDNGKTLIDTQNITHTGSGSETFSNTITGDGYSAVRMTVTEIDGGLSSGFGSTSEYSASYSDDTITITVNSTADDIADDGDCTLREAIISANDDNESGSTDGECAAGSTEDTIEFDIAGGGVHTIQPTGTGLPAITGSHTTIDGYSQTGAVENSGDYSTCFEGTIKIEIDGSSANDNSDGITVSADNTTVKGLAINRFAGSNGNGVEVNSGDDNVVAGNILGLDNDGLVDRGNGDAGVSITDSAGDTLVGGSNPEDRNIISGNGGYGGLGIFSDFGTQTIKGNCIGPDATGNSAVANAHSGINIWQADASINIGGTSAGDKNVISGNTDFGISVGEDSTVNSIYGNYIGTNANGEADLGNDDQGIYVASDGAVINLGGTSSGERNIVSGNDSDGIAINATGSVENLKGNYIGLDASGEVGIGNSVAGINDSSSNSVIGGSTNGAGNVVSDNVGGGINVDGNATTVIGNLIGTSADGLDVIGNTSAGIKSGGNNVVIGGDSASERNVVAGTIVGGNFNGSGIVLISFGGGLSGGVVKGNYVGTNINGTIGGGFGNGGFGIFVVGDYSNAVIGGTADGEDNKIVSSGMSGVAVTGFNAVGPSGIYPANISILGNQIYESTSTGIRLMADTDSNYVPDTPIPFPNDSGDGDSDTNDYLNFPVLNSSSASAGSLDVNFDLDIPDSNSGVTGYRVEFFANDTGDSSGNGEGQIYLGHADVAGDVTNHSESITLDPGVITTGDYDISATVTEIDGSTDGFGATSEFSAFLNDQSIVQPLDNDADGVNDAVENAGPNGGDGNDDGTLDSEQASVATIMDAESDDYVTLAVDPDGECNQIDDFASKLESELSESDPDYIYPLTLVEFTIPCADSVDGTIYWHGEEEFTSQIYRKFGPTTPGDSSTTSWYTAEQFITSTEDIGGEATATASFTLTDGEAGDDTGNDNIIVDANGPGLDQDSTDSVIDSISSAVSDTLSNTGMNQYGIYVLAGALIAGSSIFVIKRKLFSKTSK